MQGIPESKGFIAFLLQIVCARVVSVIETYNPQNVANTLWSFATLGEYPNPELLDLLGKRAVENIKVSMMWICRVDRQRDHGLYRRKSFCASGLL